MRTIPVLILMLLTAPIAAARADDGRLERERERIEAHLAHVELTLRARDVCHLGSEQRAARAASLDRLRVYREAGVFPRNTRHPDEYLPYFIDDYGTACAVAHLVIASGSGDLAQAVASGENHAYVPDMTTSGLVAWAEASGFTIDELAMIQPSYCGPDFDAAPCGGADAGTGGRRDDDGGCSVSSPGASPGAPSVLALLTLAVAVAVRRGRSR